MILANWISATGKTLTTTNITHGHSDHYFGLTTLLEQFPLAKAVALREVADAIDPGAPTLSSLARAKAMLGDQIPDHPIRPAPMDGNKIDVERHELVAIALGQSDADVSTVL